MNQVKEIGEVYVLLHMDCELRCKVCPYLGLNGAYKSNYFKKKYGEGKRIDVDILKKFIDEIQNYLPKIITLSGGEPLTYDGWVEIAKYAKSKNIRVSLSTNGIYIGKYIKEIISYVDSININLGGTPDILPQVRCADYGFNEVVTNVIKLNKIKERLNINNPKIKITYVISDISYHRIKEFYEYFKSRNINVDEFFFQHMMYITPQDLYSQKRLWYNMGFPTDLWEGFCFCIGDIDFKEFLDQIHYLEKFHNVNFSPKMTHEEIKMYYDPSRKDKVKRNIKCIAPWNQVDIYPNGDIMVCPDYVVGNIKKESFNKLWNNRKACWLREKIKQGRRFPGCNSCFYYYISDEDPDKV